MSRTDELRNELQAIAGDELADVLASWDSMDAGHRAKLRRYLSAELSDYGMLSLDQLKESHDDRNRVNAIRRQARMMVIS